MEPSTTPPPPSPGTLPARSAPKPRGFLSPAKVRAFAFWTITLCILISVVASILAIWKFAEQDALWRTIATCLVIGFGTMVFALVNMSFGVSDESR
jgi:hypothetical protein